MSIETYEKLAGKFELNKLLDEGLDAVEQDKTKPFREALYFKLKEAESEAKTTDKRYSHKEVFDELRSKLSDKVESV